MKSSSLRIEVRLKDLITMISNLQLFRPVKIIRKNDKDFYHLKFRNKGLDFKNIHLRKLGFVTYIGENWVV